MGITETSAMGSVSQHSTSVDKAETTSPKLAEKARRLGKVVATKLRPKGKTSSSVSDRHVQQEKIEREAVHQLIELFTARDRHCGWRMYDGDGAKHWLRGQAETLNRMGILSKDEKIDEVLVNPKRCDEVRSKTKELADQLKTNGQLAAYIHQEASQL